MATFTIPAKHWQPGLSIEVDLGGGLVKRTYTPEVKTAQPMRVWLVPLVYKVGKTEHRLGSNEAETQAALANFATTLTERLKAMTPLEQSEAGVEVKVLPLAKELVYVQGETGKPLAGQGLQMTQRINSAIGAWEELVKVFWKDYVNGKILPANPNIPHSDWFCLVVPYVRGGTHAAFEIQGRSNIGGICDWNHLPAFIGTPLPGETLKQKIETTVLHELGHGHLLKHVEAQAGCTKAGVPDATYPYHPTGQIGVPGWEPGPPPRDIKAEESDLMTYCPSRWLSDYHFTVSVQAPTNDA